jgi:hypothetical protein
MLSIQIRNSTMEETQQQAWPPCPTANKQQLASRLFGIGIIIVIIVGRDKLRVDVTDVGTHAVLSGLVAYPELGASWIRLPALALSADMTAWELANATATLSPVCWLRLLAPLGWSAADYLTIRCKRRRC